MDEVLLCKMQLIDLVYMLLDQSFISGLINRTTAALTVDSGLSRVRIKINTVAHRYLNF